MGLKWLISPTIPLPLAFGLHIQVETIPNFLVICVAHMIILFIIKVKILMLIK